MPVPDIGTDRQLFLDEAMIADLDGDGAREAPGEGPFQGGLRWIRR